MTWPVTPNPSIHDDTKGVKQQSPFTGAQLATWVERLPLAMVKDLVNAILAAFGLSSVIPTADDIVTDAYNALLDIPQGNISGLVSSLESILTTIIGGLGGGNNLGSSFQGLIGDAQAALGTVVTSFSPVNPAQIGENLWPLGAFPYAISISGSGVWVFDSAVTHTADSTGSVRVTADGSMKALRGIPTVVTAGQQVNVSVFTQWDGYVGTGTPIQLQIAQYNKVGSVETLVGIVTVTTLGPTTASSGWAELSGTYTAPLDGSVNLIRGRLMVTDAATAGTIWFDDASATSQIQSGSVGGLSDTLGGIVSRIQAVIDAAVQVLTGSSSIGNSMQDFMFALSNILPANVGGVLGPGTISDTIINTIESLIGGMVGQSGSGSGLADLFNIGKQVSSNASQGANAWQVLGIRDNTSTSSGFLPSGRSNFDLTAVAFASSAPTIAVTQAASAICYDRVPVSQPLGVVSWLGYGLTDITAFYVNVWKWDATSSSWDLAHHSPNIIGDLTDAASATSPVFLFYTLDTPLAQVATEQYLYEYVPVGSGTHHMVGQTTGSWVPNHPTAPVSQYGYTRDNTSTPDSPPSTIAKADMAGADTVPWTECAVNEGSATADSYDPLEIYFNSDGTVPIPNWADYADVVVVGKGGDGAAGTVGSYGNPGTPGAYNATTWVRGTHFSGTSTVITFAGSSISIPSYSIAGTDGVDGSGTRLAVLGAPVGKGPGTFDYKGISATGGGDQTVFGGAGTTPGGAGNGGYWFGLYTPGGQGGSPAAWVQFRQAALAGETTGSGTGLTAPDAPTLSLVGVTQSTITVTTLGGYPQPAANDLHGVDSPRAFGSMMVTHQAATGDADGTTEIPHKVPYTL